MTKTRTTTAKYWRLSIKGKLSGKVVQWEAVVQVRAQLRRQKATTANDTPIDDIDDIRKQAKMKLRKQLLETKEKLREVDKMPLKELLNVLHH